MQHFWIILKIQSAFILFSQTSSVNAIPHSLLFISSLLVSLDVWIKRQRGVKAIREKEIKSGFDNKAYPSNEAGDYEKKQTVTKKCVQHGVIVTEHTNGIGIVTTKQC